MKFPPYCNLPIHHKARAANVYKTDLAKFYREWREQHTPPEVVRTAHRVGDDYDHVERTAYLDSPGDFK